MSTTIAISGKGGGQAEQPGIFHRSGDNRI